MAIANSAHRPVSTCISLHISAQHGAAYVYTRNFVYAHTNIEDTHMLTQALGTTHGLLASSLRISRGFANAVPAWGMEAAKATGDFPLSYSHGSLYCWWLKTDTSDPIHVS